MMIKDNLITKIKTILKGIDEDECNSQDGWWETSEGASFGKTKLAEVVAMLEALEQPSWQGLSDDELYRIYGEVHDNCVKDFPSELYAAWFKNTKEKNT